MTKLRYIRAGAFVVFFTAFIATGVLGWPYRNSATIDRFLVAVDLRPGDFSPFQPHGLLPAWSTASGSICFKAFESVTSAQRLNADRISNNIMIFQCPLFVPPLALSAWEIAAIVGHLRSKARKKKIARGLCPDCGYDLRATSDRCPECGMKTGKSPQGFQSGSS